MISTLNTFLTSLPQEEFVIITPNRRLAHFIQSQYDLLNKKTSTWLTLNLFTLQDWLKSLWLNRNQEIDKLLLDSFVEKVLLKKINNESKINTTTLLTTQKLIAEWQLDIDKKNLYSEEQKGAFNSLENFNNYCTENNFITTTSLITHITKLTENSAIPLPKKIILFNFDEISPAFKKLLDTLEKKDIAVSIFDSKQEKTAEATKFTFNSLKEELTAAADFAKKINIEKPDTKIGIVVPNLETLRPQIVDIFKDHFFEQPELVNISYGKPLTEYQAIGDALTLLSLLSKETISRNEISQLANSNHFINYNEEKLARSFLALHTKSELPDNFSLTGWFNFAQKIKTNFFKKNGYAPFLLNNLKKAYFVLEKDSANKKMSVVKFIELVNNILHIMAWPNEHGTILNQIITRWHKLLDDFLLLDTINHTVSFQEGVTLLITKASNTIFQPQSKTAINAPINILGTLEAAGLHFDYLWIMELNSDIWPSKANPDPFIPIKLQKEHELPHASVAREVTFTKNLQERLLKSTEKAVVSFAKIGTETSREYEESSLIKNIEEISHKEWSEDSQDLISTIYQSRNLEIKLDDKAQPIGEKEKIWGGSKILEHVAACPFRAFAKCRLKILSDESGNIGLNPRERGTLLHDALALTWEKLQTQESLANCSKQELDFIITYALDGAFENLSKNVTIVFPHLLQAEKVRNKKLLLAWLKKELLRTPFSVKIIEKSYTFTLEGLTMKMKIDRVDSLEENNTAIVIDYKTGANVAMPSAWRDERPDDVQLPLYALASRGEENFNIKGLAYARLHNKNLSFVGISDDEKTLPGVKTLAKNKIYHDLDIKDVNELLHYLKQNLTALAKKFMQGDAEVDPKNSSESCRYCGLESLCRINSKGKK